MEIPTKPNLAMSITEMMAPLSQSKDGRGAHREAMKLLREEDHDSNANTDANNVNTKINDDDNSGSTSSLLDGSFGELMGKPIDPPSNRESNGHGNKFDQSIQSLRTQRESSRNFETGQDSPVAKSKSRPPHSRRSMLGSSRQLSSKGLNNIDKSSWHGPLLDKSSGRPAPKQRGMRRNKSLDETTWGLGSPSRNHAPYTGRAGARNRRSNVAANEGESKDDNDLQTSTCKKTTASRSIGGNRHQLTASRRAASLRNLYGNPNNRDCDHEVEEAPLNDAVGGTSKRALNRRSQSKRQLSSTSGLRMTRSNHSASGSGGTGMTVYSWHDGGVVATRSTRRNKAKGVANAISINNSSSQLNNSKSSLRSNGMSSDNSDGNLSFGSFGFDDDDDDEVGVCDNGEPDDPGTITREGRRSMGSLSGSRDRSSSGGNKSSSASRRSRRRRSSSRDEHVDTDSEGSTKARHTRRNRSRPKDNVGVQNRRSRSTSRDRDCLDEREITSDKNKSTASREPSNKNSGKDRQCRNDRDVADNVRDSDKKMEQNGHRRSKEKANRRRSNSRSRNHGGKNEDRSSRRHDDNTTTKFNKDTEDNAASRDAEEEPVLTEADSLPKGTRTVETKNTKDNTRTSKGLSISTKLAKDSSQNESKDFGGGVFGMSATSIEFDMLDWDAESAATSSTDANNNKKNQESTACFQLQFPPIEM